MFKGVKRVKQIGEAVQKGGGIFKNQWPPGPFSFKNEEGFELRMKAENQGSHSVDCYRGK